MKGLLLIIFSICLIVNAQAALKCGQGAYWADIKANLIDKWNPDDDSAINFADYKQNYDSLEATVVTLDHPVNNGHCKQYFNTDGAKSCCNDADYKEWIRNAVIASISAAVPASKSDKCHSLKTKVKQALEICKQAAQAAASSSIENSSENSNASSTDSNSLESQSSNNTESSSDPSQSAENKSSSSTKGPKNSQSSASASPSSSKSGSQSSRSSGSGSGSGSNSQSSGKKSSSSGSNSESSSLDSSDGQNEDESGDSVSTESEVEVEEESSTTEVEDSTVEEESSTESEVESTTQDETTNEDTTETESTTQEQTTGQDSTVTESSSVVDSTVVDSSPEVSESIQALEEQVAAADRKTSAFGMKSLSDAAKAIAQQLRGTLCVVCSDPEVSNSIYNFESNTWFVNQLSMGNFINKISEAFNSTTTNSNDCLSSIQFKINRHEKKYGTCAEATKIFEDNQNLVAPCQNSADCVTQSATCSDQFGTGCLDTLATDIQINITSRRTERRDRMIRRRIVATNSKFTKVEKGGAELEVDPSEDAYLIIGGIPLKQIQSEADDANVQFNTAGGNVDYQALKNAQDHQFSIKCVSSVILFSMVILVF